MGEVINNKLSLQHCIRTTAGVMLKLKFVHLINFCVGGQVIASKSATALILDRCKQCSKRKLK